jgi:type I restriction enzyme S subunit
VSVSNNKYKQTSIGLIPTDWEIKKLGEIVDYKKGFAFQTSQYKNEGVRIIRVSDTNAEGIKRDGNVYIDSVEAKNHKEYQLLENDIVIQTVGSRPPLYDSMVGKTILVNKEFEGSLLNQNAVRLREKNGNNYFLFSLFRRKEYFDFIETLVRGNANQVSITLEDLFKYQIPYPKSLPEQQKIATILSNWDAAIDNCKVIIDRLQERNKGLAQQLLTGKMRVQGFEKKWKLTPLNECLNFTPREVPKPTGNYLALGLRSHGKGIFHKHDIDPEDVAMDVLYEVKENDLIINITFAWEQAVAIVSKQDEGGLVSHRFPTYTFNADKAIPEFFRHFILQKYFKFLMELISPGGAGRNRVMSKTDFLKLEVKLPDVTEQKAIANILNTATAELSQYQQKLQFLQQQKKGLMQQLLTGKIRVNYER